MPQIEDGLEKDFSEWSCACEEVARRAGSRAQSGATEGSEDARGRGEQPRFLLGGTGRPGHALGLPAGLRMVQA